MPRTGTKSSTTDSTTKSLETNYIGPVSGKMLVNRVPTINHRLLARNILQQSHLARFQLQVDGLSPTWKLSQHLRLLSDVGGHLAA